ncbi:DsbA family protein [Gordonia iterans]
MTKSTKISIALAAVVVLTIGIFLFVSAGDDDSDISAVDGPSTAANTELLVRADSNKLSNGPEATFVEFLDFECEGCLAAFPAVEELRTKYGDRVTFVVRHMPLHNNSMNAALASEAAANQGKFEPMYKRLFETVGEWGHKEDSQEEYFAGLARDLGLDMNRYSADVKDPATRARVDQSTKDGTALGVQGTPTFFLNGERLNPRTAQDLQAAFDNALDE